MPDIIRTMLLVCMMVKTDATYIFRLEAAGLISIFFRKVGYTSGLDSTGTTCSVLITHLKHRYLSRTFCFSAFLRY